MSGDELVGALGAIVLILVFIGIYALVDWINGQDKGDGS